MSRSSLRLCVLLGLLVLWPSLASAQWYVNGYLGKVMSANFKEPIDEKPMLFGVAAGTSPFKRVGVEIDFQHINNFFGAEDVLGHNKVQTLTGAVHFGPVLQAGKTLKFKPYGIAGGGLGILDIGPEFTFDEAAFDALPPAQQTTIINCVDAFGTDDPTAAQLMACGVPGTSEQQVGYKPILSFGGGLMVSFSKHVGASVDFRYFMQFPVDESQKFHFWRVAVGVVIHR